MQCMLVDFDGVILRNHISSKFIANRCQNYVQIKTNTHARYSKFLNKNLYETTGHSLIGLHKLGYNQYTIRDFNEYVYGDIEYSSMFNDIQTTHAHDIQQFIDLNEWTKNNNTKMFIFSNAPDEWCLNICNLMSPKLSDIETTNIILKNRFLKPDQDAYTVLDYHLKNFKKIVNVDDKLMNLMPTIDNKKWEHFLMKDEKYPISNNLYVIQELDEIINTIKI